MNILIIGTTDILGGAAKISWDIKTALEKQGHEVSMFVADKRSDDPKVKIIPRQKWRKVLGFLLATDDLLSSDWILNTKEFKEADIVHCHNLHGRFFNLSTLQKMSLIKPVIWTLHDEWALTPHCVHSFGSTTLRNGLYVSPDISIPPRLLWNNTSYLSWRKSSIYKRSKLHIVVPSLWLKNRLEKTILNEQDVRLIPNSIDTSSFKHVEKTEARKKLDLPQDKKIILFLADDAKKNIWKGWEYCEKIIEKYKDRNDVLFLNVGNQTDHPSTSHVIYRGKISGSENLSLYYSAADILLFTSVAENFPLVILEAMSTGLPIVSFDVGGVKEALTHEENGYIAGYKHVEELERGLEWAFGLSTEEKNRISEASIRKARECYDISHMTDEYMKLYQELLSK